MDTDELTEKAYNSIVFAAGFNDFFSDMGLDERSQVWGETFPVDDADQTGNHIVSFDRNFDELLSHDYYLYSDPRKDQWFGVPVFFPHSIG